MEAISDFKSAIPEPYQILGLRLLPLSLGRYRLLKRFNCNFVSEEAATASIGDLILGIVICAMRCDEFLDYYESGRFFDFIKRWSKAVGINPPWYLRGKYGKIVSCTFIGKRWRKKHSFNFVEKMNLFKNYIEAAQVLPNYVPTQEGKRSTAHWSTSVEITLRSEIGWTEEEINEAPLSKAISDYFKHLENQGAVTIFTEQDITEGEANAAALEAAMKGAHGP